MNAIWDKIKEIELALQELKSLLQAENAPAPAPVDAPTPASAPGVVVGPWGEWDEAAAQASLAEGLRQIENIRAMRAENKEARRRHQAILSDLPAQEMRKAKLKELAAPLEAALGEPYNGNALGLGGWGTRAGVFVSNNPEYRDCFQRLLEAEREQKKLLDFVPPHPYIPEEETVMIERRLHQTIHPETVVDFASAAGASPKARPAIFRAPRWVGDKLAKGEIVSGVARVDAQKDKAGVWTYTVHYDPAATDRAYLCRAAQGISALSEGARQYGFASKHGRTAILIVGPAGTTFAEHGYNNKGNRQVTL